MGGAHEVVDAIEFAHHAQVADQEATAIAAGVVGRHPVELLQARPRAHHVDVLRILAPALDRDALVGLVGADHHVGQGEGHPLGDQQQAMEDAALAELGLVEFRIQVVVIEDEAGAVEQLEPRRDDEDQIGRIAGMKDLEAALAAHAAGQGPFVPQGAGVLAQVADGGTDLGGQGMAIDVHPIEHFIERFIALTGRTDHRDLVTGIDQRGGLEPHPAVERHRQILDDDQHVAPGARASAGAGLLIDGFRLLQHTPDPSGESQPCIRRG